VEWRGRFGREVSCHAFPLSSYLIDPLPLALAAASRCRRRLPAWIGRGSLTVLDRFERKLLLPLVDAAETTAVWAGVDSIGLLCP
jgi:hypothetical protein